MSRMGRAGLALAVLASVVIVQPVAAAPAHLVVAAHAVIENAMRTGGEASDNFRLLNDGTADATIVSVELSGPDASEFDVPAHEIGTRIEIGRTGSVSFDFRPTTSGYKSATGVVTYDTDAHDEANVTDTVIVTFEAFATRSPTGLVAVGGVQEVGEVPQDDWAPYSMSLRNRAEIPTTITSFDIDRMRIRDDSECEAGVTIEPDESCVLRLEFTHDLPSARTWQLGVRQAAPFGELLVRFEGTVVRVIRDDTDPIVDPLAWPRPVRVAFGSSPTVTVRQPVSARDALPVRFSVDLRDLTAQTKRRLATLKDIDHIYVALSLNRQWRFAVTATDSSGNVSDEELGGAIRLSVMDLPVASGWSSRTVSGFAKGGTVKTSIAGRELSLSITGRTATLLARRGPTSGAVDIYVDGRLRRTVSLYATRTGSAPTVFMPVVLGGGAHEVRLVTRASEGRHVFELDAFVVVR